MKCTQLDQNQEKSTKDLLNQWWNQSIQMFMVP
jgi:1,2-phenylacetyl-CoA epoxidase catalytic subunit